MIIRSIMNHPECVALRVNQFYMIVQSKEHSREGYKVRHDGKHAIECDTEKCENARHGKKECWHLKRVNEELAFDRLEARDAELTAQALMVEASEILTLAEVPVKVEQTVMSTALRGNLNGDRSFHLMR